MKNLDNNLQIRPYVQNDYTSVIELYKEGDLFEKDFDTKNALERKIERDPESILVAVRNNEIVGTISIMEDGKLAFIFRLVVKKSLRRQGIGTQLIAAAEKILKQRGNPTVNIIVNEKDVDLQGYYEQLNYKKGRVWRWMWKEIN